MRRKRLEGPQGVINICTKKPNVNTPIRTEATVAQQPEAKTSVVRLCE